MRFRPKTAGTPGPDFSGPSGVSGLFFPVVGSVVSGCEEWNLLCFDHPFIDACWTGTVFAAGVPTKRVLVPFCMASPAFML